MNAILVRANTPRANLTGAKPVVVAKNVNNGWFIYERTIDGQLFLEIPQGANADSARAWADLMLED